MSSLDPEDAKLITLARSARGRTGAAEGAAVRDTDGRTYLAATVDLPIDEGVETVGGLLARELGLVPSEGSATEVGGLRLVAESTGGRRNQIDTILVCRVPEPGADDETVVEQPAREPQPAAVEG